MTAATTAGSFRRAVHTRDKCGIMNGALWRVRLQNTIAVRCVPPYGARREERQKQAIINNKPEPLRIQRNLGFHVRIRISPTLTRRCDRLCTLYILQHNLPLGFPFPKKFSKCYETRLASCISNSFIHLQFMTQQSFESRGREFFYKPSKNVVWKKNAF